jgi:hypothetical protein
MDLSALDDFPGSPSPDYSPCPLDKKLLSPLSESLTPPALPRPFGSSQNPLNLADDDDGDGDGDDKPSHPVPNAPREVGERGGLEQRARRARVGGAERGGGWPELDLALTHMQIEATKLEKCMRSPPLGANLRLGRGSGWLALDGPLTHGRNAAAGATAAEEVELAAAPRCRRCEGAARLEWPNGSDAGVLRAS